MVPPQGGAALLTLVFSILAYLGYEKLPEIASDSAVKKVTPIAEEAAKKAAIEVVGERLPGAVTAELAKQKGRAKVAADEAEFAKAAAEQA